MKAVFYYIDYRKFLEHYFVEKKKQSRQFSFRYFADKTGINSTSFFTRVIDGRRNLTSKTTEKISDAIGFNHKEALYFRHLVLFNQSKTSREKQEQYLLLRNLSGSVKESVLKIKQYDYFNMWYTVIIRELVCIYDFQDDFKKLAKAVLPIIKPLEAKQAIKRLLDLGLLAKDKDGKYHQKDKVITADDSVASLAVRSFSDTMLVKAREALHKMKKEERHISTMTVGISPECYSLIKGEIQLFEDRIKAIVENDEGSSRVFQFNTQFFPVSSDTKDLSQNSLEKGPDTK